MRNSEYIIEVGSTKDIVRPLRLKENLTAEQAFQTIWGVTTDEAYTAVQDIFKTFDGSPIDFYDRLIKCYEYVLYGTNDFCLNCEDLKETADAFRAIAKILNLAYDQHNDDIHYYKEDLPYEKGGAMDIIHTALDAITSHDSAEHSRYEFAQIYARYICPEACKPMEGHTTADLLFQIRFIVEHFNGLHKALPAINQYFLLQEANSLTSNPNKTPVITK